MRENRSEKKLVLLSRLNSALNILIIIDSVKRAVDYFGPSK